MKVRITTFYLQHKAGAIVEVRPQDAVLLVAQKRAEYVTDEPEIERVASKMTAETLVKQKELEQEVEPEVEPEVTHKAAKMTTKKVVKK
jgi:hypothetical protein